MDNLFGMTLEQLQQVTDSLSMPRFAAKQIAGWLYGKNATSIDQMTNLSLASRERLKERFELSIVPPAAVSESTDGTKKYLFATRSGRFVEAAYIPDGERATLCISSQAGCKMGCKFCMTGRQGFGGNLTAADILNQIVALPERERLTNVVLMGMGEPLDNADNVIDALSVLTSPWGMGWSPTRITLSTVGVIPSLRRFLDQSRVNLAVSLHNPFSDERAAMMPVERVWPVAEVVDLIRQYDFKHQRRVSFEYIVLEGLNHSERHVRELSRLLNGFPCRINLIRFHRIPDSPFASPAEGEVVAFRDALTRKGIVTTIRASRGEDIKAACGLLSTEAIETARRNDLAAAPNED